MTRSDLREIVRAAMAATARFSAMTSLSAWTGNIMADDLPVYGVVTPRERIKPGALAAFEREILLQVVIKRIGGDDLEDVLDEDADEIEAVILSALKPQRVICTPEEATFVLNGDGEQKVGTAVVSITVQYMKAVPR